MPFDGNNWKTSKLVPYKALLTQLHNLYGPLERLQDDTNDTSKHWRVPGHKGSIGFITRYVWLFQGGFRADNLPAVCYLLLVGETDLLAA